MPQFCRSVWLCWVLCLEFHKVKVKVLTELCSFWEALGMNLLPSLLKLLAGFIPCGGGIGVLFLAGCQWGGKGLFLLLEATHVPAPVVQVAPCSSGGGTPL